jgi:branched-chain amino acid aminotransferase
VNTGERPRIYLDGEIVPFESANIHLLSPCVKYGLAAFEGIRGYWSERENAVLLFRLREHAERLRASARVLGFSPLPSVDEIEEAIAATVRANGFRQKIHIRATIFAGGIGELDSQDRPGFAVAALPLPTNARVQAGVRAHVSSWRRMPDEAMPARAKVNGNYVNSRLAAMEARRDGYDAAIMLNTRGKVSEGPTMCLFIVRRGVAVTPGVTSDILESITRDTVLRLLADEIGVPVQERDVDRSELYDCEEAFFCGTGYEVCPIRSIDGFELAAKKEGVVPRVMEAYRRVTLGENEARRGWVTPVHAS